ncbi:Pentatricopeptide repeat [Dillenia turbinata]|uniref:Pentatricopeptide repeat n=1 Tax=Dillenia turbinata TaxID=194707 RepID=A0AAN8WE97_9MAGN
MASVKPSISLDPFESKQLSFLGLLPLYHHRFPHLPKTHVGNFFNRLDNIRVSRLETNLLSPLKANDDTVGETLILGNPSFHGETRKGVRRSVNKRPRVKEKVNKGENIKFTSIARNGLVGLELDDGVELSLEHCNVILKHFEQHSDSKAIEFFEWMRRNGKLKENVTAYNLALRVMGRRGDWDRAEAMIKELGSDSDRDLDFQVFNTLIYACSKKGLCDLGAKWFHLMLENKAKPNLATFGMLMSLYKKGWDVDEAEFAFHYMRSLKLKCQAAYSAMITIYTRLRLYDKAEEVIACMRKDDVIPNLESWLVMLNAYCQQGKLLEAEALSISMQEAGFSPNIVAYNTMITGYGKASNMDAAQLLFERLQNVELEPDETTYRSMIEGWGRADNYPKVVWYYWELKRLNFKPNSSNLYTLINLQAKHEDEEGAVRTLNDMRAMGCQYSSILGNLLQAYERAGRIDKVPIILKNSFNEHVLVNQTSCSILVMAYVKHGLVDDTIRVLREKQWKDQTFEDNLYHLLICSCKEFGHFDNAVKIYTKMPKYDDKPNLHITSTMIDVYSIMGLFTEAGNLFMKLKSSGISLDLIAYSIVVRMYIKAGSWNDACAVLDTMEKQKNIIPDVYLCRDMFRIYQQCGLVDKLAALYYQLLKSEIKWDQEMYNCVINCCSRALPVDELSRVFEEMIQQGFEPNTITYNVMLDVFGKSRLFKKASKVFSMAKQQGAVDVISYNTIIAAYGKSKDLSSMSSTVEKMQFAGFSVSLEAYNCMLDAYGKEGQMESFREVLQRMKDSSSAADHYTYNIMINIYGERGWIGEVAEVLKELKASGLGPDLCSYNTLIKAYGIAGMVEHAVGLVKEMREKGIEPDRVTYTNLITALRKNDKFLEAVKWSLWMKQMGL